MRESFRDSQREKDERVEKEPQSLQEAGGGNET